MKRRVAFRSVAILLATVLLLSSTSAYNILVYANQDSIANSLSAIEAASGVSETEPSISTQGGELSLNADETQTTESVVLEGAKGTPSTTWGSQQNPYLISDALEFYAVNKLVHATETASGDNTQKHFKLVGDVDLSDLIDFDTGTIKYYKADGDGERAGNAYLVSADSTQSDSQIVKFNFDGDGHKIYINKEKFSGKLNIPNYANFAIFGYVGADSVISNVVFENINVDVSYGAPRSVSIISYRNDGKIENCQVNDCSITLGASSTGGAYDANSFNETTGFYFGVAAAVADNRRTVDNVNVSNFTVNIPANAANDYLGGVVAQNRGSVLSSSISGLKFNIHNGTHYVGGLAGYNAADAAVSASAVYFGSRTTDTFNRGNINGGGYVGGLVGYNDGSISNSSVTGTIINTRTASSTVNNILGTTSSDNDTVAYFGGVTGVNKGTVEKATVSDLGVYMSTSYVLNDSYFGGIAAITTGIIETSVASGSFVASNGADCYAGGIIAYADSSTPDGAVKDCYALFNLSNPDKKFVGAVVGFGGNVNTAADCYWSELVTGCVTSYVIEDTAVYTIEHVKGNMVSDNRAVVVPKNNYDDIAPSEIAHSFEALGTIPPASVQTLGDSNGEGEYTNNIHVNVSAANNSLVKRQYNIRFSFPSEVGSDDKQDLIVAANLDVLLTSGQGDPDSKDEPFIVESTATAKFIRLAPYGHYKLDSDVAVSSSDWYASIFTGTLDGDGRMIAADTNIFSYVIGNRNFAPVVDADNRTDPKLACNDDTYGIISNLNVDLSGNINNAVFGTAYDASFINIDFTDGDPTPDDGDKVSYEGFVVKITENNSGGFVNSAVGYSYFYDCTSDVSVELEENENIGGFIGYLNGRVYIDNCSVTSVGAYLNYENSTNSRAVFVGNPLANSGRIMNVVVSAQVIGSSNAVCHVVFGGSMYPAYKGLHNITWSMNSYEANRSASSADYHDAIKLWGSDGKAYTNDTVAPGSTVKFIVGIPQNVSIFENTSLADYSISLVNIDEITGAETEYVPASDQAKFSIKNTVIADSAINVDISVSADAGNNDVIYIKIYHYNTGFVTYKKYNVAQRDFEPGSDGYYHIYSLADLEKFSELTRTNNNAVNLDYTSYAYKLMEDIYIPEDYVFTPIASVSDPFTGTFDGNNKTIYDLRIGNSESSDVALFAAAVFYSDTVELVDNQGNSLGTTASGIYNLTIDGATITGRNNVAALVARNSNGSNSNSSMGSLNLGNITVKNSEIIGTESANTGAVVAYSLLSSIDISGVTLENVTVTTQYQGSEYFRNNFATTVGGIGGIIGCIDENSESNISLVHSIKDINISGLTLAGAPIDGADAMAPAEQKYGYATVNAGAIFGTYQVFNNDNGFVTAVMNIGDSASDAEYDVILNDFVIKASGMTGGLIGSTNVQTIIDKVKVSGGNDKSSKILSDTDLYIGGIAGYIGSYQYEFYSATGFSSVTDDEDINRALVNSYGQIKNSIVENITIKATDEAIVSQEIELSRNVAVGGIAGAINGPQTGATVENCEVKNSHIEGLAVGGIVGSNIERALTSDLMQNISLSAKNSIVVKDCSVSNSLVTTPGIETTVGITTVKQCYPAYDMTDSTAMNYKTCALVYGVGGIVGTNRRSEFAFANELVIENCEVDEKTSITNYIPYIQYFADGSYMAQTAHIATGGLIGSVYASRLVSLNSHTELNNNFVASYILSEANVPVLDQYSNVIVSLYNEASTVLSGTGGFIGMISGCNYTQASLQFMNITNGVFAGRVISYNGIGGVVGAIAVADQFAVDGFNTVAMYMPENFISDIAITGSLESKADISQLIRGGMVIGHASVGLAQASNLQWGSSNFTISLINNGGQEGSAEKAFNNIYYSTFGKSYDEKSTFPFIGYYGASKSGYDNYGSLQSSFGNPVYHKQTFSNSYYDVNLTAGLTSVYQFDDFGNVSYSYQAEIQNVNPQMSDVQSDSPYTIPNDNQTAPAEYRGIFKLSNDTSHWRSSNSGQASVTSDSFDTLTVTPKNISPSPVKISINYVGTVAGRTVELPVGFLFDSTAQTPLDYVVDDNGIKRYILTNPMDFSVIAAGSSKAYDDNNPLKLNYWIYNDIDFDSADFVFAENFVDGFAAIGTKEKPFIGSISSMPAGASYTSPETGETYESNGEIRTITGIGQFKPTTVYTDASAAENNIVVAGLFGYTKNATFENFKVYDVAFNAPTAAGSATVNYAATVAAIAAGSLNAEGITVENADIIGAEYSGGLFGGLFKDSASENASVWNITDSKLIGIGEETEESVYYSNITGKKGAAGIVVHTDHTSSAVIRGVEVSGAAITQQADTSPDYTYYDNGAAGISLAYSGEIAAGSARNRVINSKIKGEVASGAVVRSYTSANADAFKSSETNSYVNGITQYGASKLHINDVDIVGTTIEGTIGFSEDDFATFINKLVASGGILARLDLYSGIKDADYMISSCSLDSKTTVSALYGAGGVLGTYEMYPIPDKTSDTYDYGIDIDSCQIDATVRTTSTVNVVAANNLANYQNSGCGGVIGYLSNYAPVTKTTIKNCSVTGTISANSTMGGIIGGLWTNASTDNISDAMRFDKSDIHFSENCVITADFVNAETGANAFSSSYTPATGLVVGFAYNVTQSGDVYSGNEGFSNDLTNLPFFNIYYSAYKYTMGKTYLFGVLNPNASTIYSLNYKAGDEYSCYTDYIYDINYYNAETDEFNCIVNESSHAITSTETGRITPPDASNENGVYVVDYRMAQSGFTFDVNELGFNTATDSSLNYTFGITDSNNPLEGFVLSTTAGAGSGANQSVAAFDRIEANNSKIEVNKSGSNITVRAKEVLTKSAPFDLIFVYSNGLELSIPFRIEVASYDFYRTKNSTGEKTYYVFNASNLYSTMSWVNPSDNIVQAFDIFCTLDSNTVAATVNDFTKEITLSEAYGSAFVHALAGTEHPNPDYDPDGDARENIPTTEYLGVDDETELGQLSLSKLVKELGVVEFGAYKSNSNSSIYSKDPFSGTYQVLNAPAGYNSGVEGTQDYTKYAIYGLELHSVNVTAQGTDAQFAGMFNALSGATISDITFVNPKVEVIASKSDEDRQGNFVGVLAGTAANANISNIKVVNTNPADRTKAYVMSIRQMTAASTYVGGIVGAAYTGTKLSGCSVSGLDVVGSSLAGNVTGSVKTVYAGAIAGLSEVGVANPVVQNSRVLVNHNDRYRMSYLSYAGGIAGKLTGAVSNAVISDTVLRDCECEVVSDENGVYKGSYTAQDGRHENTADRIGGVAGYGYGTLNVTNAQITSVDVTAFDIAGGVVAELESSSGSNLSVSASKLEEAEVRILSSAVVASEGSLRYFYNTAGGVVGLVQNASQINVTDTDVIGYVGTYSYESTGRDATAGGIIGYITDKLNSLNGITVSASSVQGEVSGFRNNRYSEDDEITESALKNLGTAGGFIGKVYSSAVRTKFAPMISESVMSADVNLYISTAGVKVDASPLDPANSPSTNVGKLLGALIAPENGTNFAQSATDIRVYFDNIIISSYPQNIVLFGCQDFYKNHSSSFDPAVIVTDVNTTESGEGNLKIGLSGDMSSNPAEDEFSTLALIVIGDDGAPVSRFFKLENENFAFANGEIVTFLPDGEPEILLNAERGGALPEISINQEGEKSYFTISNLKKADAGKLAVSYTYGLKVSADFIASDIQGAGTADNEFQVRKPEHLLVINSLPNAFYKQMNDIDLSSEYGYSESVADPLWADGNGFNPIGKASSPFTGSYDGQGYVITNLFVSRKGSDNIGLFGSVAGTTAKRAVIKNLHVEIASQLSVAQNPLRPSVLTVLTGGVIGKDNVGGLVGRATYADITNCSVVRGNVIGNSAVGGLVGRTNEATELISCFTSTTSSSYSTNQNSIASSKNVGALVGLVGGKTDVSNSFTLGYASVGASKDNSKNNGAAGGLAGYVSTGVTLTVEDAFVGATVSDYIGTPSNNINYKGLVIGSADVSSNVYVRDMFISAPAALSYSASSAINPILGNSNGAKGFVEGADGTITSAPLAAEHNVRYDSDLIGVFNAQISNTSANELGAQASGFSFDGITIGTAQGEDSYTDAYVSLAKIGLTVDAQEIADRKGTDENGNAFDKNYKGGLFYPVRFSEAGWTLTSSVMDMTDTLSYPEGMDADFYGNGSNKNTDLLFKDFVDESADYTSIHLNVFSDAVGKHAFSGNVGDEGYGSLYSNGEFFYDCEMPYFTVEKQMDGAEHQLYRKFVYPVQIRYGETTAGRTYPLSTERQLTALSQPEPSGKFAMLSRNLSYTLVEDIDITSEAFYPIEEFRGSFNGNNNSITNLNIVPNPQSSDNDNIGLFATLSNGSVKDLTLVVNSVTGGSNVGALVGAVEAQSESSVSIINCNVIGSTNESYVQGSQNVGGLIGKAQYATGYTMSDSSSAVEVRGTNVAGGLIGYCELPIVNCYATGNVTAVVDDSSSSAARGVGGLVGVYTNSGAETRFRYSFASGAVEVTDAQYNTSAEYGIGGLVGYVGENIDILAVFSSGVVRYCYDDNSESDNSSIPDCSGLTLGIGGLIGVQGSKINDVYSGASIAARVGEVGNAVNVGIGGVTGVAKADLEGAYSSGSTLGFTATDFDENNPITDYNYGVGGVIGVLPEGISGNNLYFDINVSVLDDIVGKVCDPTDTDDKSNRGSTTTADMTAGENSSLNRANALGENFGFTSGAYPYLITFFNESISQTIQFNALLSIVAIQLNELDKTAAAGEGISMAMTIPTGITHNNVRYTYGFEADNTHGGSATSIVDETTNLLSVQRTSNTKEQANFLITISAIDGNNSNASGVLYSSIANRQLSRVCAQMLGTQDYPYLVASVTDLEHVAMSADELAACPEESYYHQWNTPLNENGNEASGKVHYRMMGPIDLIVKDTNGEIVKEYGREFSSLENGYIFDGNGYELRQLETSLVDILDSNSVVKNIKLVDVSFSSGESLVGTLGGEVNGVTLNGTMTGSDVAGVAKTIGESGKVNGVVSNLTYTGSAQSNVAGIALENNGTVELSASVGSFGSKASPLSGMNSVSAMVGENNGTIKNSFTMGDIFLDAPAGVVGGFVGSNSGTIENCYTRCNIKVSGAAAANSAESALSIGSFAAKNTGSVTGCYASGLFDVRQSAQVVENETVFEATEGIKTVFIGTNNGTVTNSVLDKQMSGMSFKNDFWLAEHTADVISLENHKSLKQGTQENPSAYTVQTAPADSTGQAVYSDEYPQLTAILNTKTFEQQLDDQGNPLYDGDNNPIYTDVETAQSRMYRTLRSYSGISAATATVNNDNYIDNLAVGTRSAISRNFVWASSNMEAGVVQVDTVNNITNKYFMANAESKDIVLNTTVAVEDYYNTGEIINYTFNLYPAVTDGKNPNFAGGNGEAATPFEISTPEQVVALSYYGKNADNNFIVINDIDMSDADWSAYINEFKGKLDGGGYVLYNTTIDGGNNALIGKMQGGTVENLGLSGIDVNYTSNSAAGMLVANVVNGATIKNCVVVGSVKPADETVNSYSVGGLVGVADSTTVIDGCVVSGKVIGGGSDGTATPNVGGIVGKADSETVISNSLSTALVSGGPNSTVGGIVGGAEGDSVAISNTVFAGNVNSSTANNLIGDGSEAIGANNYFDKLFSTAQVGGTPATTYYLTTSDELLGKFVTEGENPVETMTRYEGFVGYPVPVAFVGEGYSDMFVEAVKLASAKISLSSGVSAGSVTAFTSVSAPASIGGANAVLTIILDDDSGANDYIGGSNNSYSVNTGNLPLNQKLNGTITYKLGDTTAVRYVDFSLGKIVNRITYTINGLDANAKSIISVVTGSGNTATAATAFDSTGEGTLCRNMIFDYEIVSGNAKIFSVDTKLPAGYYQGQVKVEFFSEDSTEPIHTVTVDSSAEDWDGTWDIIIPVGTPNFNNVKITVTANEDDHDTKWGIHKHIGLFS